MIVSFVETMRGAVKDAAGKNHPIEFDLKAESTSLRDFLRTGMTKVSGLLNAAPWAQETPLAGTLRISAKERRIEYRLNAGPRLFLEGTKNITPLSILRTMTLMPVTVRDAQGNTLGTGEMRFDLKDLAPFLASWLPIRKEAQRALDVRRRQIERRLLTGA